MCLAALQGCIWADWLAGDFVSEPYIQTTLLRLYTNQLDGVDVVALEALPDADLGFVCAAPEADDVAGGVREGGDLAVVRQDGVGARAGQQVPHADHPVLQIDKISFV